jgi:hypothetical protein
VKGWKVLERHADADGKVPGYLWVDILRAKENKDHERRHRKERFKKLLAKIGVKRGA